MTFDPNFRVSECGAVYYPKDGHVCPKDVKNLPMPPAPPQPAVTLVDAPDEEQRA